MKTRKSVAICGYWLERVGRRLVLWSGQCGAWSLVSGDADRELIAGCGFNLNSPDVAWVVGDQARGRKDQ
jgi:hypothetical protein